MTDYIKMNECLSTCAYAHILHPVTLQQLVNKWLKEDTPSFDYGGFVVGERRDTAVLLMKSPGVLAGVPFFDAVFKQLDCDVEWLVQEGSDNEPVSELARVSGQVRRILLGERVALNCLSRVSGIATIARNVSKMTQNLGWHGKIAGTRKTTPGFRLPEKYGLLVGGVDTHRYDLSSMIMLKDNHVTIAGNIGKAVKDARSVGGFAKKIEVEARSLDEAQHAAAAGADIIMLDNFTSQNAKDASSTLKSLYPRILIEASGGITAENVADYLDDNIDIISMSKLTQGYDCLDFSLKIIDKNIII